MSAGAMVLLLVMAPAVAAAAEPVTGRDVELIPASAKILKDRPRLLVRPKDTPLAVSLAQLRAIPRDEEFGLLLAQLRTCDGAAPHALAWLLTGEKTDAEKALATVQAWKTPKDPGDPFTVYFGCRDIALAYDWLHTYAGFTDEIKSQTRDKLFPLAEGGFKRGNDHVFHNYVWMWNSGAALWALAAAGDDPRCDKLLDGVRARFNADMFPAMAYLEGQPADSPGYWSLYCLAPGVMTLLCAQSAFDQDLAGKVAREGGAWLDGQLENLVHQTLPNLRNMPWGDQQSGPDGAITHEMACNIDMMTWATKSPAGAHLSKCLTAARAAKRFYGETAMFYFLYTRNLKATPREPPLSHLSGGKHGGNWFAREKWDDGATVVALHCTDAYTGHNHFDQGSFVIYRNGLLALDAGQYKNVGGSQQKTVSHNTLLFGGSPQRRVRPSYNPTLDNFRNALKPGRNSFEAGNILFHEDKGAWAAAAGEFGQAYDATVVGRAVRQVLFLRTGTAVVVDHLSAPADKELPEVSWLLHVPSSPKVDKDCLTAENGKSWLRCRALLPGGAAPAISDGLATLLDGGKKAAPTWQAEFKYPGKPTLTLVHLLEVGDGTPGALSAAQCTPVAAGVELTLGGRTFTFSTRDPFAVTETRRAP